MKRAVVVIPCDTRVDDTFKITENCIRSLKSSEKEGTFDIVIVDQRADSPLADCFLGNNDNIFIFNYPPNDDWGYHRAFIFGYRKYKESFESVRTEWVILSNNDVVFTKGWLTQMNLVHARDPEIQSMSPICPVTHIASGIIDFIRKSSGVNEDKTVIYGWRTGHFVAGWCIAIRTDLFDSFLAEYLFDPRYVGYYSDVDYSMKLMKHCIKHVLVCTSQVIHIGNKTQKGKWEEDNYKDRLQFEDNWNIGTFDQNPDFDYVLNLWNSLNRF